MRTHDVCLAVGILEVTLGYLIDLLDICYGIQLADSRGDIGVIFA